MASFNQVTLIGNITRDLQLKYLPSGGAVVEFGVAMNRKFKTASGEAREEVTFVDCASFGKTAETLNQYVHKGDPIFLVGRLKFDSWDDKNGGGKRSKLSVVIDTFQFMASRRDGEAQPSRTQQPNRPLERQESHPVGAGTPLHDFNGEEVPESEIPW